MLPSVLAMPIRWRVATILEERGISAYRLARDAELEPSTIYKLKAPVDVKHIDGRTLAKLCRVLDCEPGDLLEYRARETQPAPPTGKRAVKKRS